jgi:glucosyl-3-phosphoglycerate phosphatase
VISFDVRRPPTHPPAGRVFLVRHGRTALNADGRLRGRLNPVLDAVGHHEVDELARVLAGHRIVRILTSPLTRAAETAQAIGAATWEPVTALSALLDRDYGRWAGVRESEVVDRFGSLDDAAGVEPLDAVRQRVRAVLDDQREMLTHGDVVLVSHDAVNRALLRDLDSSLPENLGQRTGCWNEIRLAAGTWFVAEIDRKPVLEAGDRIERA